MISKQYYSLLNYTFNYKEMTHRLIVKSREFPSPTSTFNYTACKHYTSIYCDNKNMQ